jgi:broad specificity phosphatase PhoE
LTSRKLVLIRHAQSKPQAGRPASQWRLTQKGLADCALLADRLQPYLPATLVSSLEPKATQTAEAVAGYLGLEIQTAPGLQEHARQKTPFFDSSETFIEAVERMFRQPDELVLGEETASQAQDRFDRAARRVVAAHPNGNIWIFTHGTVLTLFVGRYNPISMVDFWRGLEMPDVVPLSFPGFRLPGAG